MSTTNPPNSPNAPLDPIALLARRFAEAISAAFPDVPEPDAQIAASKNPKFGDFQCNAAMSLSKLVAMPPREVAQKLVEHVRLDDIAEPLTPASIAGPGFINIQLKPAALATLLNTFDTPELGVEQSGNGRTVVVDLCGVNLAKQMHVGHIRSTFLGDALARTLHRLGWNVVRQNHVGDWGLNIAMVVSKLRQLKATGKPIDTLDLDQIESLYKLAQKECSADEAGLAAATKFKLGPKVLAELEEQVLGAREALLEARRTLVQLQAGDAEVHAIWKRVADVTMNECLSICARMGVDVTAAHSAGESSYAGDLAPLADDLHARAVAEVDQGALVVRVEGIDEPCLVRKSDGGFLYATTDLAAIRKRVRTMHAQRVIYCVDIRQSLHFRQVFGAAHKAGYTRLADGTAASLEHAGFGTILGEDGRPFKTRSGESVKLADLVDEAIQRAHTATDANTRDDDAPSFSSDERARIAQAVGIGALKYADLSNDRAKDYMFSFDRMLAMEGNTGPYLLYALVRTRNIRRRAQSKHAIELASYQHAAITLSAPEEKAIALALLRYPSVVKSVAEALEPHRLCQYLYDLAGAFSTFYNACHVLSAPSEDLKHSRLRLCRITERVLEDGLGLLGIQTLERM